MPLLSVVIPVYNGAPHIKHILDCFRKQSSHDFELIFVDDGSTDNTRELLDKAQKTESFPIVVETIEPLGVSAARNHGMELATGEYLTFVDVDDRIGSEYMDLLLENESREFDMLGFRSLRVPEDGPFEPKTKYEGVREIDRLDFLRLIADDPTQFGVYNFFYAREFMERYHFRFSTGYSYYEDYDFLYRVVSVAGKILQTDHQLYYYVLQEGSAVATFRVERLQNVEVLERDIPYLKEHAPEFVPAYTRWVIPRIYWSVLWQAALAFSYRDFLRYAKEGKMRKRIRSLLTYPGKKVKLTTALFQVSKTAFFCGARLLGRRRSRIGKTDYAPFHAYFKDAK